MPRSIRWAMVVLALAAGAGLAAPPAHTDASRPGAPTAGPDLDLYRIRAPAAAVDRLEEAGFDVVASRPDGTTEIVLGPGEVARLTALGYVPTRWRDGQGRSVADLARAQAAGPGPMVWKRWEGPGGFRAEIDALAAAHPDLVRTSVIGHSVQGRELVAVRVTAGVGAVADGARPAVLFLSLQHAREWISGEVNRRLLRSLVTTYGTDPMATVLLDTTELWFVLVANPDGYERTFKPNERLWRKNVADNDGDGKIGVRDGVDLNRNFPDHWAYAPQGSSNEPADQTYRGSSAASEPETKAVVGLAARVPFRFVVNYHAFGRLLLYPIGWQEQTPTADQSIYAALAGTPVNPAIPGYKPQLSADLYPTNGETASWAHGHAGALGFTVELSEGVPGSNFAFPDNEALIEEEYQLNRPFALDVARSAADPTRPQSHLGNRVPPFAVDDFDISYGDPQPVQATVLRRLGPVEVHWRVGSGPEQRAPAEEWSGGLRYGDTGDLYARRVRGSVTGARPGDTVKVWFTAGGEESGAFTYTVKSHRSGRLLVVVGGEHRQRPGGVGVPPGRGQREPLGTDALSAPSTPAARLTPVQAALDANGVDADVYDVEAHGHIAPDPLGVLGHYDAVVWTADEGPRASTSTPIPESVSRLANEEMLAARDYLNEGGRLLYMGRDAGRLYSQGAEYNPVSDGPCVPKVLPGPSAEGHDGGLISDTCVPLSGEFFQYWLGAYDLAPAGDGAADSRIAPVDGVRPPFSGVTWAFSDSRIASGPNSSFGRAAAYSATAEMIGAAYPNWGGRTAARYRAGRAGRAPDPSGPSRYGTGTGAVVETPSSLLFGFGFEDIATAGERASVMGRALSFLLAPR